MHIPPEFIFIVLTNSGCWILAQIGFDAIDGKFGLFQAFGVLVALLVIGLAFAVAAGVVK